MMGAWPRERLFEAMAALAGRAGLSLRATDALAVPADPQALEPWIERAAEWMGLEAEPIGGPYRELGDWLLGAAPALVRLSDGRFLAVLGRRRHRVVLLGPDHDRLAVGVDALRRAIAEHLERPVELEVDALLERAEVLPRQRGRACAALLQERLADAYLGGCWLLRDAPAAPFSRQLGQAGVLHRGLAFAACHLAQYILSLVAWWLVGRGALQGSFDRGWLVAWALLLVTMVPIRLGASFAAGRLAIDAGALVKQRLLLGALRLTPEEVRHQGVGQLLGRVVESEAIESLALSGGLGAAVGALELVLSAVVLGFGAGGGWQVLAVLGWTATLLVLSRRLYRRRTSWTAARLEMTHGAVEHLVGHRTRLAQKSPDNWHEGEDQLLERYLERSVAFDRAEVRLLAWVPRGCLVVGLLALAPRFVMGGYSAATLAIALGGLLLAWRALQKLTLGVSQLTGVAIAWKAVRPLLAAAQRHEPAGAPSPVPSDPTKPVLEADSLVFRHGDRTAPVVRGASLYIGAGDRLLLQGPSGGGKSTLGALLAGLRTPESGMLTLHGLDRRTLGAAGWRRRVVAAPQFHENHVLGGTFAFNLLMGRRWPPLAADVREAELICRELGLGPLLDRMPAGLQQVVGETGWQLSHGERGRLYIARALLQRADVVVLDENFAALDPQTLEGALRCVLSRAPALLVIAHP
jgi:ATP-binding cassette subfamily B protein